MRNLSFKQFCDIVKGYRFFNRQGFEIYKYELWNLGIDPKALIINDTIYRRRKRDKTRS